MLKNALLAAKTVAQTPAKRAIPKAVDVIMRPSVDPHEILDRMYRHEPIRQHLSDLWHETLVIEPVPPLHLKLEILERVLEKMMKRSREEAMKVLTAVLRAEVSRGNFLDAVALLDLVPHKSLLRVLTLPVSCIVLATSCFELWLPSYIVGSGLLIFWSGLALNFFRNPSYPRACFSAHKQTGRLSRLRRIDQLRLANFLISAFEETGSLNPRNYHLHEFYAQNIANTTSTEQSINNALRKLGISVRIWDTVVSMYADYWSHQNSRWNSVEWKEPDQDPADVEYYLARKKNANRQKELH